MTMGRKEGGFGNSEELSLIGEKLVQWSLVGGKAGKVGWGQSVDFGIKGEKRLVEKFEHYSLSNVVFEDVFHHTTNTVL